MHIVGVYDSGVSQHGIMEVIHQSPQNQPRSAILSCDSGSRLDSIGMSWPLIKFERTTRLPFARANGSGRVERRGLSTCIMMLIPEGMRYSWVAGLRGVEQTQTPINAVQFQWHPGVSIMQSSDLLLQLPDNIYLRVPPADRGKLWYIINQTYFRRTVPTPEQPHFCSHGLRKSNALPYSCLQMARIG
ncbi:uncharacterized protein BO97DRAFT_124335 [Aspergillus homomorphus CBS 101889]|uniref:Uncharacterized protein n=1 Tax=Aspergillus homomorphus (strain CBS 101889) TaxID=1450537 RepID=A0A395HT16_ASPHC|nr:hypothetical protein BO97DRAFT_124335 [Aspergillus homomorphus CBS 101889]RAL10639.1 hypothetical protein BO97DRAFT_124335 [Aspergillus homomorphus CBS 101889]